MSLTIAFKFSMVPSFSYTHLHILFCLASIVLIALVMAGCSSECGTIVDMFLISIKYGNGSATLDPLVLSPEPARLAQNVPDLSLEVRVGYFGICAKSSGTGWQCSPDADLLADGYNITDDPLNIIRLGSRFRAQIVHPWIYIACVVFTTATTMILGTFSGWHEEVDPTDGDPVEVKPFPNREKLKGCVIFSCLSAILAIAQVVWQFTSSRAAAILSEAVGYGKIEAHVGLNAAAMSWAVIVCQVMSCASSLLFFFCVMYLDNLNELPSDDDLDKEKASQPLLR